MAVNYLTTKIKRIKTEVASLLYDYDEQIKAISSIKFSDQESLICDDGYYKVEKDIPKDIIDRVSSLNNEFLDLKYALYVANVADVIVKFDTLKKTKGVKNKYEITSYKKEFFTKCSYCNHETKVNNLPVLLKDIESEFVKAFYSGFDVIVKEIGTLKFSMPETEVQKVLSSLMFDTTTFKPKSTFIPKRILKENKSFASLSRNYITHANSEEDINFLLNFDLKKLFQSQEVKDVVSSVITNSLIKYRATLLSRKVGCDLYFNSSVPFVRKVLSKVYDIDDIKIDSIIMSGMYDFIELKNISPEKRDIFLDRCSNLFLNKSKEQLFKDMLEYNSKIISLN